MLRNSEQNFGLVSILIHWIMALGVFGLFGLGLYMVELTYYDSWYQTAPYIHEGIGVLLALLLLFRIGWRLANPVPAFEPNMSSFEKFAARAAHLGMYALILAIVVSGYFITTAKGDGLNVFDLFEVPAVISKIDNLEDYAGEVHFFLAILLIALTGVHSLAALKHHFINKDLTLVRILRPGSETD